MNRMAQFAVITLSVIAAAEDTFPPLKSETAPQNFAEMWGTFDPQAEPLETEVLHEWEEQGVVLRVVRIRIGVFKGKIARLAGVYGFPKRAADDGEKLPGLLQIHGGGQYADYKACLMNAQHGYATLSIAWAGRISAPDYRVSPAEVKLFWDQQTSSPNYRITTDWGEVDGYHAPSRNQGNQFPSAAPHPWTLDSVESPRNSGWFLCAVAARRALTFLEQQPEVDPDRLGVYGHSMGGKLTVMTAVDSRVKAAAPSCGGISDRYNDSQLFRQTLGDDVSLKHVKCPIVFLSPANDFHGRIGDLPDAINEISAQEWRVTCSPHHNHQDTPPYEVATLLWMNDHLKQSFQFPKTPKAKLRLKTKSGVPVFSVATDESLPIESVEVVYTQHGKANETPRDMLNTKTRYWHHANVTQQTDGSWQARIPVQTTNSDLWVYANVKYRLPQPVSGAGYYYSTFKAETLNVSSLLTVVKSTELMAANLALQSEQSDLIESFSGDWQKHWIRYRRVPWTISTHKLRDSKWAARGASALKLEVKCQDNNQLVMVLDNYAAVVPIEGGEDWRSITLRPEDFESYDSSPLTSWDGIRSLKLTDSEQLRPLPGQPGERRRIGGRWKGPAPEFRNLMWVRDQ